MIPTHVEETENGVRAVVDSGWDGVISASRTLTPDGDMLHDCTEIVCDGEHIIDWLFHAEGEAVFSTEPGEAAFIGDKCGYESFTDVRKIDCDELSASFTLDGKTLTLRADTHNMEVFAAKSPGNPANVLRTSIILRVRGESAAFNVTFTQK